MTSIQRTSRTDDFTHAVIVDKGPRARDIVGRYTSLPRAQQGLQRWQHTNPDMQYRIVPLVTGTGVRERTA